MSIPEEIENITPEARLAIMEKHPIPSAIEWLSLYFVWVSRLSTTNEAPLKAWKLRFLRQHLSPELFSNLTVSLTQGNMDVFGKIEPVTFQDISLLLLRKRRLAKLRKLVGQEKKRNDLLKAQQAIANR